MVAGRGSRVAGSKSRFAGFKKVAGFEKNRVFLKSCEFSIECIYFSVKFIQTNLNRMQRRRFKNDRVFLLRGGGWLREVEVAYPLWA